ncbi:hypothetical protein PC122_g3978 [Phytophthora cactorum]|nr:hypothetical protein PC122_g3978 [Phytophthora cactorum]
MKLTEVYYAEGVVHNLISYGRLEEKGYASTYKDGHRDVAAKDDGRAVFDVDLRRNVLVVRGAGEKNKGNRSWLCWSAKPAGQTTSRWRRRKEHWSTSTRDWVI